MNEKRFLLPPISTLTPSTPLKMFPQFVSQVAPVVTPPPAEGQHSKSSLFTPQEDVEILRTMRMFFGQEFNNRIPWSFWQVYRKATGSTRSDSSLYHHWNGAMKKKYGSFLSEKRLDDCIKWAETALELENARLSYDNSRPTQHPLQRTKSHQAMPPELINTSQSGYIQTLPNHHHERQLVHFQSYDEKSVFHPRL